MKTLALRFLLPFGLLAILFSAFVLYRAHTVSQRHVRDLLNQQMALAMGFNLAIREYAGEQIRPAMERLVDKDEFHPETMSTSFISRQIFERVRKDFPDCIIRFASDDPRNPINQASPDELQVIQYFRQNPTAKPRVQEIQIEGQRYLAHFTPRWMKPECIRCHGEPKDAPAALLARYGNTASFHRKVGEIMALDTVAVPLDRMNAALAAETRWQSLILAVALVLLFGAVMVVFGFVVTRRLAAMASHFHEIAAHPESARLMPLAVDTHDEIGLVEGAFNQMAEHLRQAQASLEERVHQRTVELASANKELRCEIADRQRADKALRESEAQANQSARLMQGLFDAIPDVIGVQDRQRRIVRYNAAGYRFLGLTPEAARGKICYELIGCIKPCDDCATAECVVTRRPAQTEKHLPEMGIWLECRSYPVLDEQGEIAYVIEHLRDITERKRAEEDREKLQVQLTQAQKMESVGRLAGGVAHDFNNMLQAILGNAAFALQDLPADSPARESLEEIEKSARRSTELTRQLLAFARKQTIAPKVLNLNDTVAGVLKMLRRLIGEDIELSWMPGASLWPVKMDPSQLDQVLANLCVNARDAIGGVGTVTIKTTNVTLDDTYVQGHPECVPGDYVMLAVSDTGKGMDIETRSHVFEPFFTTKEPGKGTGLGLATVFGIVKQNQGLISVCSEPGQGTTFKVYLPRAEPQAPAAAAAPKRNLRGTETVLLVEDEDQILVLAQRILQQHGYTVLAARSPEAALEWAEQYSGRIHLLITDVVMPGMNGKELRQRLATLQPELRCLYMSGYTADVIAHRGVLDEGLQFLQKPFTIESLAEHVREALKQPLES